MTRTWLQDTPRGPARVDLTAPAGDPVSLLVLGHGAGGNVEAPDLVAVRTEASGAGAAVALVTQPYRVAGRRTPPPAGHLDQAWAAVLAALADTDADGDRAAVAQLPVIVGGRSSGARVACRTAAASGAVGIVALAFPLHPPGRPERSRAAELDTGLPTLVVNGERDPFGVPPRAPDRTVVVLPGERHDLKKDTGAVAAAVCGFLHDHGWAAAG
jgi:uncharacterized protein